MPWLRTLGLTIAASLLLAACVLLPGRFASSLDVRRDGAFDFAYKGEIVFVTPDELQAKAAPPAPVCFGPAPGAPPAAPPPSPPAGAIVHPVPMGSRPCTPDEAAKRAAETAANRRREGAQMAQLTGIDPTDPAAMRTFAADLAKQAGWRSVVYRGDGVFDVDFVQSGRLDRDFVFPVVPRVTFILPFVVVRKRADGAVLVSAPGFVANPAAVLARGFAAASGGSGSTPPPHGPQGSFTVTSDRAPLTNNTDDGPTRDGGRSRLAWAVSAASRTAPEALLPLDP